MLYLRYEGGEQRWNASSNHFMFRAKGHVFGRTRARKRRVGRGGESSAAVERHDRVLLRFKVKRASRVSVLMWQQ